MAKSPCGCLLVWQNTSKLSGKKQRKKSGHMEVGHIANVYDQKTKKGEQIIGTQLWMGLWGLLENKTTHLPTTSTSGS
jgi:hypothetical protein